MSAHGSADSHDPEAALHSPVNGDAQNGLSATSSRSPDKSPDTDHGMKEEQETVGGDIVIKQEPGQPPKLSRSSSQKVVSRPPQLWSHLPDSTADALASFEQIEACWYANKNMGYTEHAMECDCTEEWGRSSRFPLSLRNHFVGLFDPR
jgi:histone-lysine N-methyltransferase SETD2